MLNAKRSCNGLKLVLLIGCLFMETSQVSAQSAQTEADKHHANWQQPSEGVVFATHADGKTQYGFAGLTGEGGTRPDENTIFEIGSITKVFTAILLAEAVREKRASLNDVVSSHLPDIKFTKRSPFNKITLIELATHTSGLPRLPQNMFEGSDGNNPYVHYNEQRLMEGLVAFRRKHLQEPGEYSYSNYGMGILGYVLSQIYNQTFADLLKVKILDPLDMNSTALPFRFSELREHIREHLATPHAAGKAVNHWELGSLEGAGGMISSAQDLIRFGRAHWDINTPAGLAASLVEVAKLRFDDQGLGWRIDGDTLNHNGSTGGFHSNLEVNPKDKSVNVFLSNSAAISQEVVSEGNFEAVQGYWSGVLNTDSQSLRLEAYLDEHGRMVIYSIDQDYGSVLSSKSSFIDDSFFFSFPLIPAVFQGTLQGQLKDRELVGSVTLEDDVVVPLTLNYSPAMPKLLRSGLQEAMQESLLSLQGYWSGYLGGKKGLLVVMHVTNIGELPLIELYSPDQPSRSYAVSPATLNDREFKMNVGELDGSYTGKITRDGKNIKGKWSQGHSALLNLRYSAEKPERQ